VEGGVSEIAGYLFVGAIIGGFVLVVAGIVATGVVAFISMWGP